MIGQTRAADQASKLAEPGSPLDYGPQHAALIIRVARALTQGQPVNKATVDQIAETVGIADAEAHEFLRTITERDAQDDIVGVLGLSLNDYPHRFSVNGQRMSAWCAADTLFLPALLGRTANVESRSPVSKEPVRLTVSPQGVEAVSPASAVVSMVIIDPAHADISSVAAIWSTFCHHIFFFASRAEAERWAVGRKDIEILSVAEALGVVRQSLSRVLAHVG